MATFCIDVHHHFFPPDLQAEKRMANDKIGWKTPEDHLNWTPELSLRLMDASGIDLSIISLPAIASGDVSAKNRSAARGRNLFAAEVCQTYPSRFGFFATLPFLNDIEGCLAEIAYAFDELNADGVSIPSHCGENQSATYVGHDRYIEIWRELDRRRAVVFLHGAQTASSTPFPHPFLGIPIAEVPNETFKAAAHLVVTGRKRQFPNTKIILAHMGGTLPVLAPRVAVLSSYMSKALPSHSSTVLTPERIIEDFKTFFFETALSAYGPSLDLIQEFAGPERLLFGSDLPAVDLSTAAWFTSRLKEHCMGDAAKLRRVMCENALALFPRKASILEAAIELN